MYSIEHFSLKHVQFNQWYNSKNYTKQQKNSLIKFTKNYAWCNRYFCHHQTLLQKLNERCHQSIRFMLAFLLLLSTVDSCCRFFFSQEYQELQNSFSSIVFHQVLLWHYCCNWYSNKQKKHLNSNNIIPLINLFFSYS